MDQIPEYTVVAEETGTRLDVFIGQINTELTRTRAQKLILEGGVKVNGMPSKSNYKVRVEDTVTIEIPTPDVLEVTPEAIPLDIVYEDCDLLVINKPQGMVVHPAAGNYSGTLVNALLEHCDDLSGINGVIRPGIVHRIDKDTSGLLVVAKNDRSHLSLAKQIKEHTAERQYIALVRGNVVEQKGVIDAPIGRDPRDRKKMAVITKNSKSAVTRYRVIERFSDYTLVECTLETGRTHQIRVHMAYLGYPVAGDPRYGPRKNPLGLPGQALHAFSLKFTHPSSGELLVFEAELPTVFKELLENLRQQKQKE